MVSRVSCGGWWSVGGGPGGGVVVMVARRGVRVGGVLYNLLGRLDNGRVPRGSRGGVTPWGLGQAPVGARPKVGMVTGALFFVFLTNGVFEVKRHIFPRAHEASNQNGHNICNCLLAQFSMPFNIVLIRFCSEC